MFPLSETMNKYYRYFGLAMVVIIGVVSVLGSGGSGGGGENPPPTITSVSPAQSSDSALVTALVEAQFSIDMDPMSFDDSSFLLAVNSSNITASNISYNAASKIATFTPAADLTSGQEYFATITTAVRDSAGNNPLSSNYVWSFSVAPAIAPVSTDVFGTIDTTSPSTTSAINNDGRYIVFESMSQNIGCGSSTTQQICLKDTVSGEVTLVSTSGSLEGNTASSSPSISSDGNYVAFASTASTIGCGSGGISQICRKNLTTGIVDLVSRSATGTAGNTASSSPSISSDGNYVAFASTASNIGCGSGGISQICRKNLTTGVVELVSSDATGTVAGNNTSSAPSISSDGTYVAFASTSTNIGCGSGGISQICLKDISSGNVQLISDADPGVPIEQADGPCASPQISENGRYISFTSKATNLGSGGSIDQIYRGARE